MRDYKKLDYKKVTESLLKHPRHSKMQYAKSFRRAKWELENLDPKRYRFNNKLARAFIFVQEQFKHSTGAYAGKHFKLEDWQIFISMSLAGWQEYDLKTKQWKQRFNKALILLGRKNGKSFYASSMALAYNLIFEEQNGEIISCATNRIQASIVFKMIGDTLKTLPKGVKSRFKVTNTLITDTKTGTEYKALSKEAKSLDGMNVSVAIVDELAAHPDSSVLDVVESSMGSRENPIWIAITTMNYSLGSPVWTYIDLASQVDAGYENGVEVGMNYFYFLATPDTSAPDYDPFEPKFLLEGNPNMGISVSQQFLEQAQKDAKSLPSKRVEFLTKHMNVTAESSTVFIPAETIKDAQIEGEQLATMWKPSEALYAIIGLDMSISDDFTAIVDTLILQGNDNEHMTVSKLEAIVPTIDLKERGKHLRVPLQKWQEEGYLTQHKSQKIRHEDIFQALKSRILAYQDAGVEWILAYDAYQAEAIIQKIEEELGWCGQDSNFKVNQGFSLSEATLLTQEKLHTGKLFLEKNPLWNWFFANIEIERDTYGRVKVSKKHQTKKVDGVASLINTMKVYAYVAGSKKNEDYSFFSV